MSTTQSTAASDFALDSEKQTLSTTWRNYVAKLRSGDLGPIPALLGIGVLTIVFGFARSETFLSVRNFGNLLQQAAPIIVISMAVSFVLLLGEIDLGAGFTAGVVAAVLATRLQANWSLPATVLITAAVGGAMGLWTGFFVSKVGVPSFVVTLANFLSFQGIVLLITTEGGSVGIENKTVIAIENSNMSVALSWIVAALAVGLFAVSLLRKSFRAPTTNPLNVALLKIGVVAIGAALFVGMLSRDRAFAAAKKEIVGVPYAAPLVLLILIGTTFALTRTAWGRHLYAVGGNQEAARRAGINVTRIRMSAFVVCALLAGVGGYFLASQLGSANPQIGGGDTLLLAVGAAVIGGTSLFGGKGRLLNAVLGGVVLAIINNGLPLVGKATPFGIKEIDFSQSGIKFIVNGLVLLLAGSVDALSRKRSAA
jgi:D-xylose transport system permease protein